MPIYKRGRVWWIDLSHNGHRVRRPTKATNKAQAEKIHAKVTTQLIEGTWFDLDKGKSRTCEYPAPRALGVKVQIMSVV